MDINHLDGVYLINTEYPFHYALFIATLAGKKLGLSLQTHALRTVAGRMALNTSRSYVVRRTSYVAQPVPVPYHGCSPNSMPPVQTKWHKQDPPFCGTLWA